MEVFSVKYIDGQSADEEGSVSLSGIYKGIYSNFYRTPSVNFTLSLQYIKFYTVFTAINPVICNIPLDSEVSFPIGTTQNFLSLNNTVTFQGAGITFVGDIYTFQQGSVVTLTKLETNTWSISGTKTKLSQFENDIYATEPYTVYINTVDGNDATAKLGLFSKPYKNDSVAYSQLPTNDGNPWTFIYLCSNVTRNIIFPQNRRVRFKSENIGTFNLDNWTGYLNTTTEVYIDAPNSNLTATHNSQNSIVPTLPTYINVNNITMTNTNTGGNAYWINTDINSKIKANIVDIDLASASVKLFNLGNITVNKLITNKLLCESTANASVAELELKTGVSFFSGQFPLNKFKCFKLSGTASNVIIENNGVFDVTNLDVSANYLIRSYGILTGTMGTNFLGSMQLGFQASNVTVRRFVGKLISWNIDTSASDNLTIEDSTIYVDQYLFRTTGFSGTRTWNFRNVEIVAINTTGLVQGSSATALLIINKTGFLKTNSIFDAQTTFTDRTPTDFGQTNQILISTTVGINSDTKDTATGKISQNGKNVVIANGNNAIAYTINSQIIATFLKTGTGAITFTQGSGRTLVVNGTTQTTGLFNGLVGSTASITSVGTTDYVLITNL